MKKIINLEQSIKNMKNNDIINEIIELINYTNKIFKNI